MALTACGNPNLKRAYKVEPLQYPATVSDDAQFAACAPGAALVPYKGGVLVAGYQSWLIEPSGDPITSVGCDEAGDMFLVRGKTLEVRHKDRKADLVPLPSGDFQLVATVDPIAWLYGTLADGRGVILRFSQADGLSVLYAGDGLVRSAAVIGTTGIAAVIDDHLHTWRNGKAPVDQGVVGSAVDGLAVDGDGSLFISGPKGVVRVTPTKDAPKAESVATPIHGPLRLRADVLYVMWRETSSVLRFHPRMVDATPPPPPSAQTAPSHKHSAYWDGPGSRRRKSLDLRLGYFAMSDTAPITVSNDSTFRSLVLGDTALYHGVDLGLGLLSLFTRYLAGGVQLGIATASVPVKSAIADGSIGAIQPSATVNAFHLEVPVGVRLPLGWVSLVAGSGFEVTGLVIGAAKDAATGFVSTASATGTFLPLWGRLTFDPTCGVSIYTDGGYSKLLTGDLSDHYMFAAGLELRMAVTCKRARNE